MFLQLENIMNTQKTRSKETEGAEEGLYYFAEFFVNKNVERNKKY
jgi:hypothetical protein